MLLSLWQSFQGQCCTSTVNHSKPAFQVCDSQMQPRMELNPKGFFLNCKQICFQTNGVSFVALLYKLHAIFWFSPSTALWTYSTAISWPERSLAGKEDTGDEWLSANNISEHAQTVYMLGFFCYRLTILCNCSLY